MRDHHVRISRAPRRSRSRNFVQLRRGILATRAGSRTALAGLHAAAIQRAHGQVDIAGPHARAGDAQALGQLQPLQRLGGGKFGLHQRMVDQRGQIFDRWPAEGAAREPLFSSWMCWLSRERLPGNAGPARQLVASLRGLIGAGITVDRSPGIRPHLVSCVRRSPGSSLCNHGFARFVILRILFQHHVELGRRLLVGALRVVDVGDVELRVRREIRIAVIFQIIREFL